MPDREPIDTKNLDPSGSAPLEWRRVHDRLATSVAGHDARFFLGTVRPDGRPHAAGFGAVWHDGDVYVVSGPDTQKSRNLAANPACTVSAGFADVDVVLEGEARRVTDRETLEALVAIYREVGWPAEIEGDALTAPFNAPSAGPPPWHLYRFTFHTVFAVAAAEPYGATRWRFER
jgi:hypothetical protein